MKVVSRAQITFSIFICGDGKRVWSGLQTHLVLTPLYVLINCIINTLVYSQKYEMWQTSLDSKHCKKYVFVFLLQYVLWRISFDTR